MPGRVEWGCRCERGEWGRRKVEKKMYGLEDDGVGRGNRIKEMERNE